uniref:Ig-like domain-containing protein n=1 Tax=Oreochromis aureus TaxID=47969 RepID=A0AAZ1XUB5_OREAU
WSEGPVAPVSGSLASVSAPQGSCAESGQDVTLTCRVPNNNIAKWSRADLEPEYVLLYRDGYFDPANQHPSFKDRVDLQDRQMKDGDVSLILKNVTINDSGTYECRVFIEETRSWKNSVIIYLTVVDPPGEAASWLLIVFAVWMSWWMSEVDRCFSNTKRPSASKGPIFVVVHKSLNNTNT